MGITHINADCEAEHYCSKLCKLELVDGVVSEDMDTIACGSKLVIRNFTYKDDFVDCYTLDNNNTIHDDFFFFNQASDLP